MAFSVVTSTYPISTITGTPEVYAPTTFTNALGLVTIYYVLETGVLYTTVTSTLEDLYGPSYVGSRFSKPTISNAASTTGTAATTPAASISSPGGLRPATEAGIAIGVAIPILLIVAAVAAYRNIRRRRKRRARLPEVVSATESGYNKPELDANETSKPFTQGIDRGESGEREPETTGESTTVGRAELGGRMVPRADVLAEGKEVVHEK